MGQAVKCCPCPPDSFLAHPNRAQSCMPCTKCREDQEMVSDCTPKQNRQCQCKTGKFYCDSEDCLEGCHPCTRCPEGKVVLQTCNATADTLCGPPGPGPGSRQWLWWMAGWLFATVVGALVILCVRKPGDGGCRAACCCPHAGPVSTGRPYRRDSLESSLPFVSSPEAPDADAPLPTTGAPHLPEDRLDEASEPPILPGTPESPAGGGPWPEEEAGDEAGPQAGHHDLTLLHPPTPWPEGPAEVLRDLVDTKGPPAAAEELGRPARPPYRLRDQVTTQDGLKSKLFKPGQRGSVVSVSDGPRKRPSLPIYLSPCMRQPVNEPFSRPHHSMSYTTDMESPQPGPGVCISPRTPSLPSTGVDAACPLRHSQANETPVWRLQGKED
ncbi:tumor necrosis factor receptor superfamily member 25-like [Myotis yumanensis]|uniref:tumor necrosis factor receptor superfamily member 25-like n=1 Tax=Myotis yumanensis TaxID=159337 RepID=UPI0038D4FE5C